MAEQLVLVKPSARRQQEYLAYYEEWKQSGEPFVPWVAGREPYDFGAYLAFLASEGSEESIPAGWVPHSTYWLVNGEDKILGVVNIRHRLNEHLYNAGGHIGYGIRPSERRKGYATAILALALDKTRELGLERVLVVCDRDNTGSEKTIRGNGGVLESEFTEADGNVVRRYWIAL
ncbi:GNAT family N-acetyltransferase [Brevibacillus agri]